MKIELTKDGFKKDGKPFFLISGEMHYFRVKKKDWPKHLEKMKKAGLDAVTTYIPWSWHESKEGEFDLTGQTKDERDVTGFIDMCGQMGLTLNVKPGPYILAEYQDQGIPRWLLAKHPEIQVQDSKGNNNMPFVCSFMNPTFLEYSAKWFDRIIPVIRDRQISNGGPVFMTQICNEVGLQQWLAGTGDYSPATLKYYYQFLDKKHGELQDLNVLYGKNYNRFDEVIPPAGNMENPKDIARYRDWHEFHRWYYTVYIRYLIEDLKKRGIDGPFYENVPGWVFGRAQEFPVCITLYSDVATACPELLLALDHIPENVDFRNFHDASVITEMVRSLQGRSLPVYSAEFQAGSREHCVRTYPNEMELFYKSALAYGTQGWNYYMFSQGKNSPGEGVYGPTFYWDTPLDVKGKENPLYETVSGINAWIKGNEENLVPARKEVQVGVGFYKPNYETEFFYPLFLKDKYFRPEKAGLTYDIKWIRDAFYYEGLIKVLHILNISHEIPDLQVQSIEELLQYRQLWIQCPEMMDAMTQTKLLELVKRGGHAIFYPCLPKFDLEGRRCDILKVGLGVQNQTLFCPVESRVQFFDLDPVNALPVMQELNVEGASVIAKIGKKILGVEKTIEKGHAVILGTIPNYQIEEHLEVFRRFLQREKIQTQVSCDNPELTVHLRKGPLGSFLFVMNFHPEEKDFVLGIPLNGKNVRIPSARRLTIPGSSGIILPVDQKLAGSRGKIFYSTSELFKQKLEGNTVKLKLKGSKDMAGEMLLELNAPPQKILLNGKNLAWEKTDLGYIVKYRRSSKEFTMEIL